MPKSCDIKQDRQNNNATISFIGPISVYNLDKDMLDRISNLSIVEYKIKKFSIPSDSIEEIKIPNPFNSNFSVYSGSRSQDRLTVIFNADDGLDNLLLIKDWIDIIKDKSAISQREVYFDAFINIYNNINQPLYSLVYERAGIKNVTGFDVDFGANQKTIPITATFSFLKYRKVTLPLI